MDPIVETSTPATADTAPPPAQSISEHAASFSPDVQEAAKQEQADEQRSHHSQTQRRDKTGEWKPGRHRARGHQASAEDVPRIRELTGKWRTEETARKALEEKYANLEREVQTLKQPKVEPPKPPQEFGDAEPQLDQFAQSDDPYRDYMRALAAHDRKKEAAEASKAQHQTEAQRYEQATSAELKAKYEALATTYNARQAAFQQSKADWDTVVGGIKEDPTPLLRVALLEDERGPEFVYTLGSRPDLLAELMLFSDGKSVTESSVAMMRRLLNARMQTAAAPAASGSVASPKVVYSPPKPPNPGGTGPLKTADGPPDEPKSIAEHARFFAPKR